MALPVIDFACYGLDVADTSAVSDQQLDKLSAELYEALSSWGFVYLKNHGVGEEEVSLIRRVYANFFQLPQEFKQQYKTFSKKFDAIHGWSAPAQEILDPEKPSDLKESFDALPFRHEENAKIWPEHKDIPTIKETTLSFYNRCHHLGLRILDVIAVGLQLEDRDYFSKCHKNMKPGHNYTNLRNIYYPPVVNAVLPGQQRCAEHTDYGSLTILFQDDCGGLEVFCSTTGEYVSAKPVPGCVLINIGDLMERWTGNQLVATKHRVVVPEDEHISSKARQSIAFFMHPNDDTLVVPLDGSDKRSPVLSGVHAERRFFQTYTEQDNIKS